MQPEAAPKRPYRKRRRAEQELETRRRITEAAVELHGTVGPARTTISDVARRAGVERVTVYRHFPDEAALFRACSSHWAADHPLPDAEPWRAPATAAARLEAALTEIYAYYRDAEPMLANVARDAELIPALAAVGERRRRWLEQVEELVVEPLGRQAPTARAHVGLALQFRTWRYLVRERGLEDGEAVALAVRTLPCAG